MRMIRPKLDAPQIYVGERQHADFLPVTAAVVRHPNYQARRVQANGEELDANSVVVAFRPNDEERARLAAGEDIYVSLLTFGGPMQALLVTAGPDELCAWFGVERES